MIKISDFSIGYRRIYISAYEPQDLNKKIQTLLCLSMRDAADFSNS